VRRPRPNLGIHRIASVTAALWFAAYPIRAPHCPSLYESYLGSVSVQHVRGVLKAMQRGPRATAGPR
jgi:hypothetical protein